MKTNLNVAPPSMYEHNKEQYVKCECCDIYCALLLLYCKGEYAKTIDELMHKHQKATEEKDQEIDYFRKSVQVVLVVKDRSSFLGELSKSKIVLLYYCIIIVLL